MKKGLGTVVCGNCGRTTVVIWPGQKYKIRCQACGRIMNIHRQRLKNFNELKDNKNRK